MRKTEQELKTKIEINESRINALEDEIDIIKESLTDLIKEGSPK